MRIAFVTGLCPTGECGVGDYTRRLAHALRSLGVQAELVSDGSWGLRGAGKAIKSLDKLEPDIVHIQYPTAGFGYRLGPQMFAMRRKSVITIHEASQSHILRKLSLYPFMARAQHLVFTSQYERQFASKWAPWIARLSSVIPIGSNIKAMPGGGNRRGQEIAYFGLIMPGKGLEEILELAKLIQRAGCALSIRIIGKAHSKHESYFERLRLQSRGLPVIWESDLNDEEVATRLASCAIAYLPFPDGASERRASLKAMLASGVGVVTTRGVHTPRDLEDIVKFSENVEDAYRIIRMLAEDTSERERLGRKAVEYMRQFGWDRIAALHLEVYKRVVKTQGFRTSVCLS
jgi:glycosyltransferase involved in cell wall biosynthesis